MKAGHLRIKSDFAASQSSCRVHNLGFVSVAHWKPPLGTGPCETGRPRRFTLYWGREWSWWPRPGYDKWRPWRKL